MSRTHLGVVLKSDRNSRNIDYWSFKVQNILCSRDCHHPCLPNCRARISGRTTSNSLPSLHFSFSSANPLLCGRERRHDRQDSLVSLVCLIHALDFIFQGVGRLIYFRILLIYSIFAILIRIKTFISLTICCLLNDKLSMYFFQVHTEVSSWSAWG